MSLPRALPTWWHLSWYELRASLEQLPTKCTRALAHSPVVGCTSFQNTVSFPLSLEGPVSCCLFLDSFFAHSVWWGFCLQPLKMLFAFYFHFRHFFFFFSQSSLFHTNCEACTRLSLRYFKRTQHSLNTKFSDPFLSSVQSHILWLVYILSHQLCCFTVPQ